MWHFINLTSKSLESGYKANTFEYINKKKNPPDPSKPSNAITLKD